jgi:Calcineurin-like phosphoesterase
MKFAVIIAATARFSIVGVVVVVIIILGAFLAMHPAAAYAQPASAANGTGPADFNIAAVGDWGCESETEDTVDNIISKSPEVVLGLGDAVNGKDADCWFEIVEPIDDLMKTVIGNHEIEDGNLDEILEHYDDDFQSKQYYSFRYSNTFVLVMSKETEYEEDSEQYEFVEESLENASSDSSIDWIIVAVHRQMYGSPTSAVGHEDSDLIDAYHPLFQKYGVDLVLSGHNHYYERTYPLNYYSDEENDDDDDSDGPFITTREATNYYSNPDGQIFITIGTGGESIFEFNDRKPYVVSQFDEGYGFLDITITDGGKRLVGVFYENDGSIEDEFTVTKEGMSLEVTELDEEDEEEEDDDN